MQHVFCDDVAILVSSGAKVKSMQGMELIEAGDYPGFLRLLCPMDEPTTDDLLGACQDYWALRMAGFALLGLGRVEQAKELLLVVVGRKGYGGSCLANAYRLLGDLDAAEAALGSEGKASRVGFAFEVELSPSQAALESILWYREAGALAFDAGDFVLAEKHYKEAWNQAAVWGRFLLPSIGSGLGLLYGEWGYDSKAVQYLQQVRHLANPSRKKRNDLILALALVHVGDYQQAWELLSTLEEFGALYFYALGLYHRARGSREAKAAFERGLELAKQQSLDSMVAYCALGLAHYEVGYLGLAKRFGRGSRFEMMLQLRELGFLVSRSPAEAIGALESLAAKLTKAQYLREVALVRLLMAEAYLLLGEMEEASTQARVAYSLSLSIGGVMALSQELRYLELRRYLSDLAPQLLPAVRGVGGDNVLEVYSLGRLEVNLDGKPHRFRVPKSKELLVYFLLQGRASLDQILLDVYPDHDNPKLFHYAKEDLQTIPGVDLRFDKLERAYTFAHPHLWWDYRFVNEALKHNSKGVFSVYKGPFMEGYDWAAQERVVLESKVLNEGLLLFQSYFDRQEYTQAARLLKHLVVVAPSNPYIEDYVGRLVAVLPAERGVFAALYAKELGVVPAILQKMSN